MFAQRELAQIFQRLFLLLSRKFKFKLSNG